MKINKDNQKNFISGRIKGGNTRLTSNIIKECDFNNTNGLILIKGYQEAFSSISCEFIHKTVDNFSLLSEIQR